MPNRLIAAIKTSRASLKIFLLVLFAGALIIVFTNYSVFTLYTRQYEDKMKKELTHDAVASVKDIITRRATARSAALGSAQFITLTHDNPDFKESLLKRFELHLTYIPRTTEIVFLPISEDEEMIYAIRDNYQEHFDFPQEFLDDMLKQGEGGISTYNLTTDNGLLVGTAVYNKTGQELGFLILDGNMNEIFEEVEGVSDITRNNIHRAIVDKEGNYIWKHNNYKGVFTSSTNIIQDLQKLPKAALLGETDSIKVGDKLVSYTPIGTKDNYKWVAIQFVHYDDVDFPTTLLRNTLIGINMGYMAILGGLLLFVSRIIDTEIENKKEETALELLDSIN